MATESEELHRAARARGILDDTLVREALEGIRAQLIEQWRLTPLKDHDLREKIWAIYCGAVAFEQVLNDYITTGKMANIVIEQRKKQMRQPNG